MASSIPDSASKVQAGSQPGNYRFPLSVMTTLFFMWGFITCMNDILIPYLRKAFDLNVTQGMLVQFAFFGAYFMGSLIYFLISISAGDPINRIGYKNGVLIGLLISAVGCLLFYPAAELNQYGLFLGALFTLGLGFTMLQISANPYVAILGKPETASSRLNLAQGFNSLGTTIAPLIGGFLVFEYFATGSTGADAVKVPYISLAIMLVVLAGIIFRVQLPDFTNKDEMNQGARALKFPHLKLGILAIFFYVGAEVAIGSVLINFFKLPHILGLEESEGDTFLAFYWSGAMIGRFLGAISFSDMKDQNRKLLIMAGVSLAIFGFIYLISGTSFSEIAPYLLFMVLNLLAFVLGKSLPNRTLAVFAVINVVLLVVTISSGGTVAFWSIIAVGLFNSIMWSNIFTLAIDGLGKYTSQGSSLLVMAILGGALVPVFQGLLADAFATPENADAGIQISFLVPVVCYLYILFYGLKGWKAGLNQRRPDIKPNELT